MSAVRLPFRLGGYGTIAIDPPWRFNDQGGRMNTLGYNATMADEEILALPIDTLAAEQSHLWCWTTDQHLELALACVKRWGFVFKTTIVWVKTTLDGTKLRIGGGHYVRKAHELCLFAARKLVGLVHDVPSVIFAPRLEHSQKPEALQDIAERLSPEPRIEIFARRLRSGWTCFGDQCPAQVG
jgi:N6-adenosine-specific RNA methylase IME4